MVFANVDAAPSTLPVSFLMQPQRCLIFDFAGCSYFFHSVLFMHFKFTQMHTSQSESLSHSCLEELESTTPSCKYSWKVRKAILNIMRIVPFKSLINTRVELTVLLTSLILMLHPLYLQFHQNYRNGEPKKSYSTSLPLQRHTTRTVA